MKKMAQWNSQMHFEVILDANINANSVPETKKRPKIC